MGYLKVNEAVREEHLCTTARLEFSFEGKTCRYLKVHKRKQAVVLAT